MHFQRLDRAARRRLLATVAASLILLALPQKGHAMLAAERVFTDPQVITLANAARDGNIEKIKQAIAAGANVKVVGDKGFTVTHFALYARSNAPQVMSTLLSAGADPISLLRGGESVPEYAVARDDADPEVVKVLLDQGVSPNWRLKLPTYDSNTPLLMLAIRGHNLPVIKLLVQRGAELNFVNPISGSALHYALIGTDFFMAAYLVEAGIDLSLKNYTRPGLKNPNPETAIEYFCRTEGGKRGANPSKSAFEGWKALTAALAKRGVTMPCGL